MVSAGILIMGSKFGKSGDPECGSEAVGNLDLRWDSLGETRGAVIPEHLDPDFD